MIGELKTQMPNFTTAFPEDIPFTAVKAKKYIFLYVLFQIFHMLLYQSCPFIKGGLIIEKRSRRLFVNKRIFRRDPAAHIVFHKEPVQTIHTSCIQQAAHNKDQHPSGLTCVLRIVNLFPQSDIVYHPMYPSICPRKDFRPKFPLVFIS